MQPACDKTFAQVAGETSGLNLLKTVLSLDQYSSALPDPSANYTLFAPTDAAFFALLKTFSEWQHRWLCCCCARSCHAFAWRLCLACTQRNRQLHACHLRVET